MIGRSPARLFEGELATSLTQVASTQVASSQHAPIAAIMPGLSGLRGFAALWVLLFHADRLSQVLPAAATGVVRPFIGSGWLGVDLFFLLSGFVLMHAHANQFARSFLPATPRLLAARFWRVYPLNAAVLALILILVTLDHGFAKWLGQTDGTDLSWSAFVRTLTLSTRWFSGAGGDWNQPVWSLSYEIIGYAAFPVIANLALRITDRDRALIIVLAALAILVMMSASVRMLDDNAIGGPLALYRMGLQFSAGALLYRARMLARAADADHAEHVAVCALVGIFVAVACHAAGVASIFFAGIVWALSFAPRGATGRVFASRAALFLARISFPLYLSHVVALKWTMMLIYRANVTSPWAAWVLLGVGIALIVALAWLLHLYVERPLARLARRIAHKKKGRPPRRGAALHVTGSGSLALDLHHVPNLADHAANFGGILEFAGAVHLVEPETDQRLALILLAADRRTGLRHLDGSHLSLLRQCRGISLGGLRSTTTQQVSNLLAAPLCDRLGAGLIAQCLESCADHVVRV